VTEGFADAGLLLRWCRLLSCSALLALLIGGAHAAAAAPVHIVAPAGGETLTAGQVIAVRWTGLPSEVDEMELLLEVGKTTRLCFRLTPQLAASTRSYLWQVPNLPTPEARLRLRWGRDGVEVDGEPSEAVAIEASPHAPLDGVLDRFGERWITDSAATSEAPTSGVTPVVEPCLDHAQPATIEAISEIVANGAMSRFQRTSPSQHQPCTVGTGRVTPATRCPLSIPLRP
jgi:hypothetical protein